MLFLLQRWYEFERLGCSLTAHEKEFCCCLFMYRAFFVFCRKKCGFLKKCWKSFRKKRRFFLFFFIGAPLHCVYKLLWILTKYMFLLVFFSSHMITMPRECPCNVCWFLMCTGHFFKPFNLPIIFINNHQTIVECKWQFPKDSKKPLYI